MKIRLLLLLTVYALHAVLVHYYVLQSVDTTLHSGVGKIWHVVRVYVILATLVTLPTWLTALVYCVFGLEGFGIDPTKLWKNKLG
jgi:hypothetical protein